MKDICFIIFTNENYFELLELTLKFVVDNCFFLGKKIYVISNKIPYQIDNPNVIFLESGTPFSMDGGHFGPTQDFTSGIYHYHASNVNYLNTGYYILKAGSYYGTKGTFTN
jgi:hypothetical protein